MKIRTEPLLLSAAIGALIWIVGGITTIIIGVQMMDAMLEAPIWDPAYVETMETIDPNTTDPFTIMFGESFRSLFAWSSIANLLQCLSWLAAGVVAGALYVVFYRRQEPMASGSEAGVGAAAGALAVIIGYLLISIISTWFFVPAWNEFMGQMMAFNAGGTPGAVQTFEQMSSLMVVFIAVGAICGIIIYGAIGAAMGALGGLLGNALAKPAA